MYMNDTLWWLDGSFFLNLLQFNDYAIALSQYNTII